MVRKAVKRTLPPTKAVPGAKLQTKKPVQAPGSAARVPQTTQPASKLPTQKLQPQQKQQLPQAKLQQAQPQVKSQSQAPKPAEEKSIYNKQ